MKLELIFTFTGIIIAILSYLKIRKPKLKIDKLDLSLKAVTSIRKRNKNTTLLEKTVEYDALLHTELLSAETQFIDEKELNRDEALALIKLRPYASIWLLESSLYLNINTIKILKWHPCRNLFIFLSSFTASSAYCLFLMDQIQTSASTSANENPTVLAITFISLLLIAIWLSTFSILELLSFKSHQQTLSRFFKRNPKPQYKYSLTNKPKVQL